AGRRARSELSEESGILHALGRELTCGVAEVPAAMAKLRRELEETRTQLGLARGKLAERAAEELLAAARAAGEARVIGCFEAVDAAFLRAIAKRVTAEAEFAAVLGARAADALLVLAARGAASRFDCGAWVKQVCAAHG